MTNNPLKRIWSASEVAGGSKNEDMRRVRGE
jgi:hypothetical protein